jgi:hypothetical protein
MRAVLEKYPVDAQGGIETIPELKNHLAVAVAVELSTVPLYLYPAYSIQSSNRTQWAPEMSAFRTIRSVVLEEMLHLCLARNLLTAIGGSMECYDPAVVPTYPSNMLYHKGNLQFRLEPLSSNLIRTIFMPLELPATVDAEPQDKDYLTLGQFYSAVLNAFKKFNDEQHDQLWYGRKGLSDDQASAICAQRRALQYGRAYWNDDGGGTPIVVEDMTTAGAAIATIVEQGEGEKVNDDKVPLRPDQPQLGLVELSHYAKFRMIAEELDDKKLDDVDNKDKTTWPVPLAPKPEYFDYPGQAGERQDRASDVGRLSTFFDAAYCYVLCLLDAIYVTPSDTPKPNARSKRYGLERQFIAAMGGLLYPIADLLVRYPLKEKNAKGEHLHAAPGFRYYTYPYTASRKDHLIGLCDDVIGAFPSLGGDDGVRQLLQRLPDV